jgi:hypothetical protein
MSTVFNGKIYENKQAEMEFLASTTILAKKISTVFTLKHTTDLLKTLTIALF